MDHNCIRKPSSYLFSQQFSDVLRLISELLHRLFQLDAASLPHGVRGAGRGSQVGLPRGRGGGIRGISLHLNHDVERAAFLESAVAADDLGINVGVGNDSTGDKFGKLYACLPRLLPWFLFTYWRLLFLWFIFTIVNPEKWEGHNGQSTNHLRC